MRMRISALAVLVLVFSALTRPVSAGMGSVLYCDEAGRCGTCCYSAGGCVAWCNSNCSTSTCPLTPNEMCCGAGGFSIECGRDM